MKKKMWGWGGKEGKVAGLRVKARPGGIDEGWGHGT